MFDATKTVAMCFLFLQSASLAANAQPAPNQAPPDLSQLVEGKIVSIEGKPKLILMVESFRENLIQTEITRQTFRLDKVKDAAGNELERRTALTDPKLEMELRIEIKRAGIKPRTLDLNDCKLYDLSNNQLSSKQASEKLKRLTPLVLVDRGKEHGAFTPLQARSLNPNVLLVWTEQSVHKFPGRRWDDPFADSDDDPFGGGDGDALFADDAIADFPDPPPAD